MQWNCNGTDSKAVEVRKFLGGHDPLVVILSEPRK